MPRPCPRAIPCACALALALLGATAIAQTPPPGGDKLDAKALMLSGVRLLEAKDYLGALAIFKDAYARFPSAKILLNIGTTYKLLDRTADAANAYQHYLDSRDADPARRGEVADALAELDKAVGRLEISATPDDGELQIGDDWVPFAAAKLYRVPAGKFTVLARRDGYTPETRTATIAAGEKAALMFALVELPKQVVNPTIVTVHDQVSADEGPRSRFGAFALLHVSVVPKLGSAPMLGATADVTPQISVAAAFIFGPGLFSHGDTMYTVAPPPKTGVYVGGSFAFLTGQLRPRVTAAMPVFFSSGARVSLRGAGGVEFVATRNVSMTLDIGVETELNPQSDIRHLAVVPALGVVGRL
jgi:hypothetical protein